MPRDSIFDRALVDDDDRNFEQQMEDLGVKVVKPKVTWYKTMTQRSGKVGLKDKISLTKNCLTLGGQAVEKIGADSLLNFGLYEKKDKKYIAIQASKKEGLRLSKTKANSYRVSSKALAIWLLEQGMPLGKYVFREVKGGWLAIPEGGGGR